MIVDMMMKKNIILALNLTNVFIFTKVGVTGIILGEKSVIFLPVAVMKKKNKF